MSDSDSLSLRLDNNDEPEEDIDENEVEKESQLKNLKIGVIGAGKLAYAIVCAIIGFTGIKAKNICVSGKTETNLTKFKDKGCEVTKRNYDVFTRFDCDIVFLCIHSSVIKQCYRISCDDKPIPFTVDYIPVPKHRINILSLVSGITLDQIVDCLIDRKQLEEFQLGIHRIVLNTAVAYGPKSGIGAIDVDPEDCDPLVKELLSSISTLETIPESEMDNLCSFSSSGLALSHCLSCGLVTAAYNLGFDIHSFHKMPAYAMLTAAQSVLKSEKSPLQLIEESTSLSSTSMSGLQLLNDLKYDLILETAFDAIIKAIVVSNQSNETE